mmetsp:Transcript_16596/g.31374  ORF Transcript_16596/g.31374 Transcript_16596/m.31374 type:complete len:102 (-) Transcript_16596:18-323(-)
MAAESNGCMCRCVMLVFGFSASIAVSETMFGYRASLDIEERLDIRVPQMLFRERRALVCDRWRVKKNLHLVILKSELICHLPRAAEGCVVLNVGFHGEKEG